MTGQKKRRCKRCIAVKALMHQAIGGGTNFSKNSSRKTASSTGICVRASLIAFTTSADISADHSQPGLSTFLRRAGGVLRNLSSPDDHR